MQTDEMKTVIGVASCPDPHGVGLRFTIDGGERISLSLGVEQLPALYPLIASRQTPPVPPSEELLPPILRAPTNSSDPSPPVEAFLTGAGFVPSHRGMELVLRLSFGRQGSTALAVPLDTFLKLIPMLGEPLIQTPAKPDQN